MKKLFVITPAPKKLVSRIKVASVPMTMGAYTGITLPHGLSKRRCERLWRTLKPTSGSVILPPHSSAAEFHLPQKYAFSVDKALSYILLEAALLLLKTNEDRAREITLCIADRSGKYAAYTKRFLSRCKTLKIYTENPYAYFKECEGMLNSHGCEPVISDKPGSCDVLLLPQSHIICIGSRRLKLNPDCVKLLGDSDLPAALQLAVLVDNRRLLNGKSSISLYENGNKTNIGKIQL
ncbi:MAG: hypothetical protein ACI396_09615 [Acutalibacteraceae bacterium]